MKPDKRREAVPRTDKLQKVLAEYGHGSRREMERWIEAGRVQVNGEPAHVGQRVGAGDRIRVDGKSAGRKAPLSGRILLYNKPAGVVCTRRDPQNRPTMFDKLPELSHGRWISVGRLDIATTGLLLITSDGDLANRMMHPSSGIDREYAVRVNGRLSDEQMKMALTGVEDNGELLRLSDIQHYDGRGANHWYHVVLLEGKNREIRRLFTQLGCQVSRLKRVRFGPVLIPSRLARGRVMEMSREDVELLYKVLKLPYMRPPGRSQRKRGKQPPSVLIPYPELPG